jgi:putative Mg2+ transporter-C (MgtC) family protein
MNAEISDLFDPALRLLAATAIGMLIGMNRDLHGKPTGMRTLGLVSLGAAIVAVGTTQHPMMMDHPDALSRVIQGIIQGVLAGVGFIGAGVILRRPDKHMVKNLTTAATVWIVAALGLVCGLARWPVVGLGAAIALLVILSKPLEHWLLARLRAPAPADDSSDGGDNS